MRRVEEIEKGNTFIRNLDLESMVTPGVLESKVREESKFLQEKQESMRTILINSIETRQKEVTDRCKQMIQERVSKHEYTKSKSFMQASIRDI